MVALTADLFPPCPVCCSTQPETHCGPLSAGPQCHFGLIILTVRSD